MENSEECPNCRSTNLHHGCCGDTMSTCRSCGFAFDTGVSVPCPISRPLEQTAEIPLPDHPLLLEDIRWIMDDGEEEENKMWGD